MYDVYLQSTHKIYIICIITCLHPINRVLHNWVIEKRE